MWYIETPKENEGVGEKSKEDFYDKTTYDPSLCIRFKEVLSFCLIYIIIHNSSSEVWVTFLFADENGTERLGQGHKTAMMFNLV